jgi:hypothetical protein
LITGIIFTQYSGSAPPLQIHSEGKFISGFHAIFFEQRIFKKFGKSGKSLKLNFLAFKRKERVKINLSR